MLTIVFAVVPAWVALKMLVWGIRATWGIAKILSSGLLLPLLIIGTVYVGIIHLTIPALAVMQILKLKSLGYTFEEIAPLVGFKSHSAAVKHFIAPDLLTMLN